MYFACNLCRKSFPEDWQDGYCGKCIHVKAQHEQLLETIREQEKTIRSIRDEGFGLLDKYATELTGDSYNKTLVVSKEDMLNLWYALQLRNYKIDNPADYLVDRLRTLGVICAATDLFRTRRGTSSEESPMRQLYDACVEYCKKHSEEDRTRFPLDKVPE